MDKEASECHLVQAGKCGKKNCNASILEKCSKKEVVKRHAQTVQHEYKEEFEEIRSFWRKASHPVSAVIIGILLEYPENRKDSHSGYDDSWNQSKRNHVKEEARKQPSCWTWSMEMDKFKRCMAKKNE